MKIEFQRPFLNFTVNCQRVKGALELLSKALVIACIGLPEDGFIGREASLIFWLEERGLLETGI